MQRDKSIKEIAQAGESGTDIRDENVFSVEVPDGEIWYADTVSCTCFDSGTIGGVQASIVQDDGMLVSNINHIGEVASKDHGGTRLNAHPDVYNGNVIAVDASGNLVSIGGETHEVVWNLDVSGANSVEGHARVIGDYCVFGDNVGNFFAVDLINREVAWSYTTGNETWIRSCPAFDGENVYFADDAGDIFALDIETGNEVWTVNHASGALQTILREKDGVLFVPGGSTEGIYALDTDDGSELWNSGTTVEHGSDIAFLNDMVIYGHTSGSVHARDIANGGSVWEAEPSTSNPIIGPVVNNGNVFFGVESEDMIYRVNGDTGEIEWTHEVTTLDSDYRHMFSVDIENTVGDTTFIDSYVVAYYDYARFYAVDAESGTSETIFNDGSSPGYVHGTVDEDNGFVYYFHDYGEYEVFDLNYEWDELLDNATRTASSSDVSTPLEVGMYLYGGDTLHIGVDNPTELTELVAGIRRHT